MEKIFLNVTFMLAFGIHVRAREAASGRRLSAGGRGASVRSNMWGARVSVGSSVAERNGRNSLLAPV